MSYRVNSGRGHAIFPKRRAPRAFFGEYVPDTRNPRNDARACLAFIDSLRNHALPWQQMHAARTCEKRALEVLGARR